MIINWICTGDGAGSYFPLGPKTERFDLEADYLLYCDEIEHPEDVDDSDFYTGRTLRFG